MALLKGRLPSTPAQGKVLDPLDAQAVAALARRMRSIDLPVYAAPSASCASRPAAPQPVTLPHHGDADYRATAAI